MYSTRSVHCEPTKNERLWKSSVTQRLIFWRILQSKWVALNVTLHPVTSRMDVSLHPTINSTWLIWSRNANTRNSNRLVQADSAASQLSLLNYYKTLLKVKFSMSSQNNWYGCCIACENYPGLWFVVGWNYCQFPSSLKSHFHTIMELLCNNNNNILLWVQLGWNHFNLKLILIYQCYKIHIYRCKL